MASVGGDIRFTARYLIETPLDLARVAEVLAGEQSSGTFVRVAGETDDVRTRFRAEVIALEELPALGAPSLPSAWLERRGASGPYRRGIATVRFPAGNVGVNLATLAATVSGNIYDLGETTGVKLVSLDLPADYVREYDRPRHGLAGTRGLVGRPEGAIIGTIIKPNVGLSPAATAETVSTLLEAGVDFVKDDEVMANPPHSPLAERVKAVMEVVEAHADRTGRKPMIAFNITDETDAMRRHSEMVAAAGGTCVMASLNWCGFSAVQSLRRATELAIHGHRNGFAGMSRHPALGWEFQPYQALWRLAGVDQLHVNGLSGKFSESDESVVASARACLTPMADGDAVIPVFSSGQWAGTVQKTHEALGSDDLIFLSGGGILGHPDGPKAGVESLREAWAAVAAGEAVTERATRSPALARAFAFFGKS